MSGSTPQQLDTKGRPLPPVGQLRGGRRRDEDTSAFFRCGPGLTAEATHRELSERLADTLAHVRANPALKRPTVTVERLRRWHKAIFGELFKGAAGRFREPWEDVACPVTLHDDEGEERKVLFYGTPGNEIRKEVATACDRFSAVKAAFAAGSASVEDVGHALAKLMVDLLRIHPFLDGNHRTALLAMQSVVRGVTGSIALLTDEVEEFSSDFELALVGDEYIGPLAARVTRLLTGNA